MGTAMVIFCVIRIIALNQTKYLLFAIIMGGVFTVTCILNKNEMAAKQLPRTTERLLTIRVQPDEINVEPDYYYGKATLLDYNQPVLFSGSIKTNTANHFNLDFVKTTTMLVKAEIREVNFATNQNQFNPQQYYAVQGITNSIKIKSIETLNNNAKFNLINSIHNFRMGLINYANQLPKPLNLYVLSLIIGEMNSEVYDEISGIKQLGLIHLFSISGLHVYYFISIIERLLIYLRVRRERYQIIIMLILPFYFIFSGSSVGLLRAILMVETGLIAKCFKWRVRGIDIWSIALMINLLLAPRMLIQFGSQLSYALSFGLIFTNKMGFFKQTILMNMLSIPFVVFHVYEWHILTFLANLFILPLFSMLIFPIVIIGMGCFMIMPQVSIWIAQLLNIFDIVINFLGSLPGNILFGKPPILVVASLFLLTLLLIDNHKTKRWLVILGTYFITFLMIHFPLTGEVVYFDVGQGDSFLIREPLNKSVTLIDTGGRVIFGKQQVQTKFNAEKTSINYLKSIGINKIDNLLITHQDADHSGDLPAFLTKMKVVNLIIPVGMQNNQNFMAKINGKMNRTNLLLARDGNQFVNKKIAVFHPFSQGMGTNEDSLVVGSHINNLNWLFTGDLDQNGENQVIGKYPMLRADVLKAGHHGSKTSTADRFLANVNPKVAIISAGRDNRYGHPHAEVVQRLNEHKIKIYNTQNDGMITYRYSVISGNGKFKTYMQR